MGNMRYHFCYTIRTTLTEKQKTHLRTARMNGKGIYLSLTADQVQNDQGSDEVKLLNQQFNRYESCRVNNQPFKFFVYAY